jgi:DNA-directed RNA polymerase subunit RPC12/RpoP
VYFHEKVVIVLLMSEHDHSDFDETMEYICEDCRTVFEDSANDPHDRCPCCDRKNIAFFIRTTNED